MKNIDYKELNGLTEKIERIDSLLNHPNQIKIIAQIPSTGYGASIYDAAPNMEILVWMTQDEAKFLLSEYRKFIENKIENLTK